MDEPYIIICVVSQDIFLNHCTEPIYYSTHPFIYNTKTTLNAILKKNVTTEDGDH